MRRLTALVLAALSLMLAACTEEPADEQAEDSAPVTTTTTANTTTTTAPATTTTADALTDQIAQAEANIYDTAYAECGALPNIDQLLGSGDPFTVAQEYAEEAVRGPPDSFDSRRPLTLRFAAAEGCEAAIYGVPPATACRDGRLCQE